MLKPLTVWITTNCGKFKGWEYQTTWPASWEIHMQFKKQQLELDMEQWTGSKKWEGHQDCIFSLCLSNLYAECIMQNARLNESQGGIKISRRSINNFRYANDTTPVAERSSVQFSCSVVSNSLRAHGLKHARPPCPSPTPRVYSNSCPLNRWCYPTILSSVFPFSHLQSFPLPGSFQMSQFIWSGGQSTRVLVSASVPPMNIQSLFPLGWTGWISLQSKGLSRVFFNTTVQKYQFFGSQPYS